jgi:rhodanese-related sulfurtransferase
MQTMMEAIDVETLARMRSDGSAHVVLDVREDLECAICAIADSLFIPMQRVAEQLHRLPHDRPLVVLCHHGVRSAMVTGYLLQRGFDNARNLTGGIDAWARRIEIGMPRY